jgi:methylase of polypeptide subunit release factors
LNRFDGGGSILKEDFTRLVSELVRERGAAFNQCLEWCAGMGEIGRDLLNHNLVNKLVLLDINKMALDEGSERWGSEGIRYCHSDNLSNLSKSEKFDLVVGNPPSYANVSRKHPFYAELKGDLRPFDPDWNLRKGFYNEIAKHLTSDGVILINEVELYKSKVFIKELWDDRPAPPVGEFVDMIERNGLRVGPCYFLREVDGVKVYMMESRM